ncbi:hypothetical protein KEM52_006512 [Ascosphaera acerosa]|nr:hypothetical protein KEM52_006512 [Ascosphaera acerosa]
MASSSSKTLPPVKACLFDMDGLLLNTEDMYTAVINIILSQHGKPNLPWSIKAQLQGRPYPQATKIFHDWAQLPISIEEYSRQVAELQAQHFPHCAPLPGAVELLHNLASTAATSTPVHIALATSSTERNYHLKTDHLQSLFSLFPPSRRVVGDDPRIGHGRGKPLPDIYLLALETINSELRADGKPEIKPQECLVFEDSVPGVEAGRRAGMQVAWVPMAGLLNEYRGREDEVLAGRIGAYQEADLPVLDKPEEWRRASPGKVGEVGDGFGRLFNSLENFPYESYGMNIPSLN